jgi:hypothetical protein
MQSQQRFRKVHHRTFYAIAMIGALTFAWQTSHAVPGQVLGEQKISNLSGGMESALASYSVFGEAIAPLGDLNGDGVPDIAVGAPEFPLNKFSGGSVWILFLNPDGTVSEKQEIAGGGSGGFEGLILGGDHFGSAVANLGDVDGDGVVDLAVGAKGDDGEKFKDVDFGAVWILFLNPDGTVKDEQKISQTEGGFQGDLLAGSLFGSHIAALGDVDGDSVPDLSVGGWVLLLNSDGTVKEEQDVSGFCSNTITGIGDFDGDGIGDFAVSCGIQDVVDLVFLKSDGSVKSIATITGINADLGGACTSLGDFDGDGVTDLACGAAPESDYGGGVTILLLNADGTLKKEQLITEGVGGFEGSLEFLDCFGCGLASPGDLDGDGVIDLAVGAPEDDDGGEDAGAVWMLFLNGLEGDITNDNEVNVVDLLALLSAWGACDNPANCPADLDGDGFVDVNDLLFLLDNWS